ncbi:MAG: serine/threonine protein kinase [Gemmataceae bacterium]|nr:serine/threonine protein kinase [Gemmataceae bacterium]
MQDRLSRMTAGAGGQAASRPTGPNLTGRTFMGKYTIVNLLGEGSMGRVYLARRRGDNSQVVVKVMHPEIASQPKFVELFEREMGVMAKFQHPHVVALYDASSKDAMGPCIVMEYVPGTDLEHILARSRKIAPVRLGRLVGQLCSALQAAHNEGIVHRDLKPANLMVVKPDTSEESLKVMDFGLAKLALAPHIRLEKLQGDNRDVATGTPEYMSTEQSRGGEVDHRSDIYSVGVILYELLTGKLPFQRDTIEKILAAHIADPPPPFKAVAAAGTVPSAVESVVMRCLLKYPNERFQSAWELALAYEKAVGEKVLAGIEPPAASNPKAAAGPAPVRPKDPNAVVYEMEAWMPESIAVIKLRGFVSDAGGDVVESIPGMIRVSLGGAKCKYQVGGAAPPPPAKKGGWFSAAPAAPVAPPNLIDVELHMQKLTGGQQNLALTLMIKPARGSTIRKTSLEWREVCERIYKDLRAYLMSK